MDGFPSFGLRPAALRIGLPAGARVLPGAGHRSGPRDEPRPSTTCSRTRARGLRARRRCRARARRRPSSVHLLDEDDATRSSRTRTRPCRRPAATSTAIVTIDDGATRRAFVQLDRRRCAGMVRARRPTRSMTTIALTSAGRPLDGSRRTHGSPAPSGAFLYAAYRDAGTGGIRVYRDRHGHPDAEDAVHRPRPRSPTGPGDRGR